MRVLRKHLRAAVPVLFLLVSASILGWPLCVSAQEQLSSQQLTPEMLAEASRRTGLSQEELLRRYQARAGEADTPAAETVNQPGRTSLEGVDDSTVEQPFVDSDQEVALPFSNLLTEEMADIFADSLLAQSVAEDSIAFFGTDFFQLDDGVFSPPSFGPVPQDYRLGVGDEVIVNVWGAIEYQETRLVDRDGSIILPGGGKIMCAGRRLAEVGNAVRQSLARSHSTIDTGDGGDTEVEVTLGKLRSIRVYVVGAVQRPGSYELSSVSRMLTALYAAGGPTVDGSFRSVRLVRGGEKIANFDLYRYLLSGDRSADAQLREGDTVFVPDVGPIVRISGEVKRPLYYEMLPGETLRDLLTFCGGFTSRAATEAVHIQRILPPEERRSGESDYTFEDVPFDAEAMHSRQGPVPILDGDVVLVDTISERMGNFVEVMGRVKRPGRYELEPGITVGDLVRVAGGLWPDALLESAVIDRTSREGGFFALSVPLGKILDGSSADVALQDGDILEVFTRWDIQDRPMVYISGEVHEAMSVPWREGMTLRDLVLKAGGLSAHADWLHAEIARLLDAAVRSHDLRRQPEQTVEVLEVSLGNDFLLRQDIPVLQPWDRVYIRKLPWWQNQRTVQIFGEVFYPGTFSLERQDERLSSVIARAGGLKPDAYLLGARIVREQEDVGNIAIDLKKALEDPGSEQDIILQDGDRLVIPDRMFTVTVRGEVGFPTSLVFQDGLKIDDYVDMAGGYLEKADKGRTRVVWPNGLSLPNKGSSKVVAGATIIVPVEPPPEGRDTWEIIRDISSVVASLATVWLIVDK